MHAGLRSVPCVYGTRCTYLDFEGKKIRFLHAKLQERKASNTLRRAGPRESNRAKIGECAGYNAQRRKSDKSVFQLHRASPLYIQSDDHTDKFLNVGYVHTTPIHHGSRDNASSK